MRTIFFGIILLFFDLGVSAQQLTYNLPAIPSGGRTDTWNPAQQPSLVYVNTGGSPVNLGGNSYTLSYSSTPAIGTGFYLYFDATQLTATAANVTLFGYQPLVVSPNLGFYRLRFDFNGSTTTVTSYTDQSVFNNVVSRTTFNASIYSNDSLVAKRIRLSPVSAVATGQSVITGDTSGDFTYGGISWVTGGNTAVGGSGVIGTLDSNSFRVVVNGISSGGVYYNLQNVALGVGSLAQNTSGNLGSAFGNSALESNTTGSGNTGIGNTALYANTTGSTNTAMGYGSLNANTTGSNNVSIGNSAATTNTTGGHNTVIGSAANVATASTIYGTAVGAGAVASSNQIAFSPGAENIYFPGMNNHLGYALIDSTGNGNYVPRSVPFLTPIIDTVTGTSSQTFTLSNNQLNVLTASTTVSGATLAFPAVQSGTIAVIWKVSTTTTTVSGTNTGTTSIPSTVAAGVSRTFVNIGGSWY